MSGEQYLEAQPSTLRTRLLQALVVAGALVVAAYLLAAPTAQQSPQFDMLSYLDGRVAAQEDEKDVRCWSSFCKLQMFLTGAAFDDDAFGVRIEEHMKLLESIWEETSREAGDSALISANDVSKVLARRFPYHFDAAQGATFELGDVLPRIHIDADALKDYSDTIEPWRLMQTWASRHTDAAGKLELEPQFDEQALAQMYEFLRTYDLAILKHARQIAETKKLARVDAGSMSEAFSLESKLRK